MRHQIAIFTLRGDLHGLVVQEALRKRGVTCHLVNTNDLLAHGGLVWSDDGLARLRSDEGTWFEVAGLDAIWWRRALQAQIPHPGVEAPDVLRLATSEWRSALLGTLQASFRGVWVNDPDAGRRAELKVTQLAAARAVGLRVPRTFVGQDPQALRAWRARHGLDRMVIKKVQGTMEIPLLTVPIAAEDLEDDASIGLCPAIYQEEVPGRRHLRIHVFGDRVLAAELESDRLDWRPDLQVPMRGTTLEPAEIRRLVALNRVLGLEMSIMDAKRTDGGDLVWLEANPQGAFLFAEALAEVDVTGALCDLLLECAGRGRRELPRSA
ncbi:MAG: hypothetical protein R3E98_16960 [Gemmatimonadota bacterium]